MTVLKEIAGKLKTGWDKTKEAVNDNAALYVASRTLPYIMMETTKAVMRHEFKKKAADPRRSRFARNLYKAGVVLTYLPTPLPIV